MLGNAQLMFALRGDLEVAQIEKSNQEQLESLRRIVSDRRRSPLQRLRDVFELCREECRANGFARQRSITSLVLDASQLSEPMRAAARCAYDECTALLAGVIREAQTDGEIGHSHDPNELASVLIMLWEGTLLLMHVERSLQPVDDFLRLNFDLLLRSGS